MSFNKGREWKKFLQIQQAQAKWYRSEGMSEAQIRAMYDYDLKACNSMRRFADHTQPLACGNGGEDGMSPLLKAFPSQLTYTIEQRQEYSLFWWIEEIDTPALVEAVKKMNKNDLLLLTGICFCRFTQQEMAKYFGLSQRGISKRISRLKKLLQ